MATEESKYELVSKNDIYEIRKYSDRLAVETITSNQSYSFRKLYNYISGGNEKKQKIEMTTPVTVIEKSGVMTMQFYLPKIFVESNVPVPAEADVRIIKIEEGYYAVLRYSSRSSDANFIKHKEILEKEDPEKMDQIQRWTYDYLSKFSKIDAKTAKKMKQELVWKRVDELFA